VIAIIFNSIWLLAVSLFLSDTVSVENNFTDARDGNSYSYKSINDLNWMTENLRFETETSMTVSDSTENCEGCGEFYFVDDAFSVCPEGWRLPQEDEVKALIKWHKKNKLDLTQNLSIQMCGRVDYAMHGKAGLQNTFWMDAPLEDGHINHWHSFNETQELHSHNVVAAKRQFPVRCVCELDEDQTELKPEK
jgi:uncharacterized protein (TIGR02145 family)